MNPIKEQQLQSYAGKTEFSAHTALSLSDRSYLGIVRKEVKKIAEAIGFTDTDLGKIDIITAELTSNLIKHTGVGGQLLVKKVRRSDVHGIEIISVDRGPGMSDAVRMMIDGVSTTQTLGQGLGAIRRLSHDFDLYSQLGWGTVVLSRYYSKSAKKQRVQADLLEYASVMVPKVGETACGDGWARCEKNGNQYFIAVDGLGHGPDAELAAQAAIQTFLASSYDAPDEMLAEMHMSIRKTRGVVGAILLKQKNGQISFCGIGNISARLYAGASNKSFSSYNGIIGMNRPSTIHNQELKPEGPQLLVMTSDGIKSRWDLTKFPTLYKHQCSTIAAVLYSEFSRRTDDTLVLVARLSK